MTFSTKLFCLVWHIVARPRGYLPQFFTALFYGKIFAFLHQIFCIFYTKIVPFFYTKMFAFLHQNLCIFYTNYFAKNIFLFLQKNFCFFFQFFCIKIFILTVFLASKILLFLHKLFVKKWCKKLPTTAVAKKISPD